MIHRTAPPLLPPWLEAMLPEATRRFAVEVEGRSIHVMELGDGPPVLMLHGNPTWGFLYRDIAKVVAESGFRCIMPDLVGLGFSDKPRDARFHTLQRHGIIIHKLIEALNLQKLVFVGQDWGGPIGLRALVENPKGLAGLVLLNTAAGPPKSDFKPTLFHKFSQIPLISTFAFRVLGFPQIVLHVAQGDRNSIRGKVAKAYRYPLRAWHNNAAPLALARMVPDALDHPSVPELQKCQDLVTAFGESTKPAAIVWGNRDPILGRLFRRTHAMLPQADPALELRAGHFLQEQVPNEIAAAVIKVAKKAFA